METRPLTPEERAILEANLRSVSGRREGLLAASLGFMLALGVSLLIAERVVPDPTLSQALPVGIALLTALVVYVRVGRQPWAQRAARELREDLARGVAEVSVHSARAAIRVEEFEDEGIGFFIELMDGRVLCLTGQYLYDPVEEKRFPCTDFTTIRAPRSRLLLDLACRGRYLEPVATRAPFTDAEYRQDLVPADGEILPADMSVF